jgi:hypothetical protein
LNLRANNACDDFCLFTSDAVTSFLRGLRSQPPSYEAAVMGTPSVADHNAIAIPNGHENNGSTTNGSAFASDENTDTSTNCQGVTICLGIGLQLFGKFVAAIILLALGAASCAMFVQFLITRTIAILRWSTHHDGDNELCECLLIAIGRAAALATFITYYAVAIILLLMNHLCQLAFDSDYMIDIYIWFDSWDILQRPDVVIIIEHRTIFTYFVRIH